MLWLSLLLFAGILLVLFSGLKFYLGQQFYEVSNIAHSVFRGPEKVNTIYIEVDGVKNGYFQVKASGWIGKEYKFDHAYVDINDSSGMLLLDRIDIKIGGEFDRVFTYDSEYIDYFGRGLFDGYPFDKKYLSSRARLVLVKDGIEIVIKPDEFVYSVYLDRSYKITKLDEKRDSFHDVMVRLPKDEALMLVEREPWFICYVLLVLFLLLIPIVSIPSGGDKMAAVDTPAFIISVYAVRELLAPERGQIYQFDVYLAGIIGVFGIVKMGALVFHLYQPDKDFLLVKRAGVRLYEGAKQLIVALRGDGEYKV